MRRFANRAALAQSLADDVAAALSARLAARGQALLAVSGGSTPDLFFNTLSKAALDWPRITVTLVDERWVPESAPRSNAALVRRALLINNAATARFVPLYNGADTPEAGCAALERALAALPFPLAAAILGMGEDGHTASFFPGSANLAAALCPEQGRLVEAIRAPGAAEPRVTLTLPPLVEAGFLALHIEGGRKHEALRQAQAPGPDEAMPVRAVLRHAPGIYWCP